jgi:hypothetical protein
MIDVRTDEWPRAARHRSPPLLALAVAFGALVIASLIAGRPTPPPFSPASSPLALAAHTGALRTAALLQLEAAVPLVLFAATACSRLRFLGIAAAGPAIGLVGGVLAAAMAALSALLTWVLSLLTLAPGSDDVVRALHLLAFGAGGPGFAVPFGLLAAGVSVPAGLAHRLPPWVVGLGLVLAAVSEAAPLALAAPAFACLLPIGRLLGLAWLAAVGATLPRERTYGEVPAEPASIGRLRVAMQTQD